MKSASQTRAASFWAAVLLVCAPLGVAFAQSDLAEDLDSFRRRPTSASAALVERLVESGDAGALELLIEHQAEIASIGARLAALQGLARHGDDPQLGARALDAVSAAAVASVGPELRDAALRALAGAGDAGRARLAELIEQP
ncbi:MAG: hypothetical protein AAFZ65_04780, partial [Planctomycetota bacterium]